MGVAIVRFGYPPALLGIALLALAATAMFGRLSRSHMTVPEGLTAVAR
jgi:hypothetical protein